MTSGLLPNVVFIGPYKIKRIVLPNIVELELLATIKIYSVVNVSRI